MVNAAASSNPQVARLARRHRVGLLAAGLVIGFACLTVAERAAAGRVSGPALACRPAPPGAVLGMTISLHVEYG